MKTEPYCTTLPKKKKKSKIQETQETTYNAANAWVTHQYNNQCSLRWEIIIITLRQSDASSANPSQLDVHAKDLQMC